MGFIWNAAEDAVDTVAGAITHPKRTIKRAAKIISNPGKYALHPLRTYRDFRDGPSKAAEVAPALPFQDSTAAANASRDRERRLARRAAGRDSTVRTGSLGAPYSAQAKSLLGG